MSLMVDAAPLVAFMDRADSQHEAVAQLLRNEPGPLVLPAPVSAEVDYLARRRLGRRAREAFFADLADGKFEMASLDSGDYELLRDYDQRYADLDVGLADLSLVILARRYRTRRVLSFDRRHFEALRPLDGGWFTILPGPPTRRRRRRQ